MHAFKHITIERRDRVAIVRLARPAARNALSIALMRELTRFARDSADDVETDVVILAGGDRFFSAGADLRDPDRWAIEDAPFVAQREVSQVGFKMCKAWEEMPAITIAAIEGYAIGGGLALALACDWRVAAEDAFVTLPEIRLGFPLTWGTIPRIVALAGPALAKRIVILAERIAAPDAHRFGLVDWVSAPGGAFARAEALAADVLAQPRASVRMSKEAINGIAGLLVSLGSNATHDQFVLASRSAESLAARERFRK
jgi:enoyl-CoA hydratase/carnithine racemase